MTLNNTAATAVAGTTVTAAFWNTEVRDAVNGIQSIWATYTPALTATTTNPTLGTGSTIAGTYQQMGKWIVGTAEIVFGTSGVAAGSGNYNISLPVAQVAGAATAGRLVGSGAYFDSSAAAASQWYTVELVAISSTTCRGVIQGFGSLSATAPVVPAASDQIRIRFEYQAA